MSEPISSIRNLGPAVEAAFLRAGVTTADQLRDIGPDDGYRRLIESGTRPHFIGYYCIVMGLQGRPWNDCQGAEKIALRARFDAIKASARGSDLSAIDKALRDIGVIEKR